MKKRAYIFDFDNTIANTAQLIASNGYDYRFSDLMFYKKMATYVRNRKTRGDTIIILSARKKIWKNDLECMIKSKFGFSVNVKFVRVHFFKWIHVHFLCMTHKNVVVVDDMLRQEESGVPKPLYYPRHSLSKVKYVVGSTVIKIRGEELL